MPEAPHLAITTFVKNDPEGRVDSFGRLAFNVFLGNAIEPCRSIIKLHTFEKLTNVRGLWTAANAYEVFAFNLARRVH